MKYAAMALSLILMASTVQANTVSCREIRIEDPCKVAPCSVPTEITVCDPFTCCEVKLTVCMPKGCVVCPEVTRHGRKVKYDFGKYEVEIHFSRKNITIDYDD